MAGFYNNLMSTLKAPYSSTQMNKYVPPNKTGNPPDPGPSSMWQGKTQDRQGQTPAFGSQSGPGILENWFNQRANGIDAASNYALKRGANDIDTRMAAGGAYNSGARGQQLSDFAANVEAQREGQLDSLAAGASGEHQRRLDSMFGQGTAIASGQSGINSAYDLAAANAQSDALKAALGFYLNKAGVDSQSNQQGIGNILKLGALFG